jgi:hypothetical protein
MPCAANGVQYQGKDTAIRCKQAVTCYSSDGADGCGMCVRHCACGTDSPVRIRREGGQAGNTNNPYRLNLDGSGVSVDSGAADSAPGTATRPRRQNSAYAMDSLTCSSDSEQDEPQLEFVPLMDESANLRDLRAAFGADPSLTSNLPSKKKRTASVSADDSSATVRIMHRAMDKAAGAVAEILVGAEKDSFIKTWHETTAGNEDVLAYIETLLGVLRRGSAEHDILSAVLATGERDSCACQNLSRMPPANDYCEIPLRHPGRT